MTSHKGGQVTRLGRFKKCPVSTEPTWLVSSLRCLAGALRAVVEGACLVVASRVRARARGFWSFYRPLSF